MVWSFFVYTQIYFYEAIYNQISSTNITANGMVIYIALTSVRKLAMSLRFNSIATSKGILWWKKKELHCNKTNKMHKSPFLNASWMKLCFWNTVMRLKYEIKYYELYPELLHVAVPCRHRKLFCQVFLLHHPMHSAHSHTLPCALMGGLPYIHTYIIMKVVQCLKFPYILVLVNWTTNPWLPPC